VRFRIIRSVLAIAVASFVSWGFAPRLLQFLIKPVGHVVFLSPGEAFLALVTLTLWGGVILASPFILYEIWTFVAEALRESEKRYVLLFGPLSLLFFMAGCLFGYFVVVPFSLKFLLRFSSSSVVHMIPVGKYLSFVAMGVVSFGCVFELPVVLFFLIKIGVASPVFLIHNRRLAIVLIFAISAILTPPDVFSQLLLAVPLVLLYEGGILFSRWAFRSKS